MADKLTDRLYNMTDAQKLDAALTMLVRIDRRLAQLERGGGAGSARTAQSEVASDAELDSRFGDEEVKKDPKRWKDAPVAPCKMSEAPIEWLEMLAEFGDWAAATSEAEAKALDAAGKPVEAQKKRTNAKYRVATARRARGWAERKRKAAAAAAAPKEEDWG